MFQVSGVGVLVSGSPTRYSEATGTLHEGEEIPSRLHSQRGSVRVIMHVQIVIIHVQIVIMHLQIVTKHLQAMFINVQRKYLVLNLFQTNIRFIKNFSKFCFPGIFPDFIFPNITRESAETKISLQLMYLCNNFFVLFGKEVSWNLECNPTFLNLTNSQTVKLIL